MHHIKDAHDWHIIDLNGHPVSIPLPVIIYQNDKGWSVFMSNKFEHGTKTHNGYKLEHGKIVAVNESGNIDEIATANIWDISITKNVTSMLISVFLMLWIFISLAKAYKGKADKAPKGIQSLLEPLIVFVRDYIAKSVIGEKHYARYVPFLMTLFFFIWINNLLGLIPIFPGGANLTGNIAIPMVMAAFTLIITVASANKNYWRHVLAMPGVPFYVLPLISLLELAGILLKPFVLMIRLFANIIAGHIVILVFFCLIFMAGEGSPASGYAAAVPILAFTVFINTLELLVGFLQAFVFTFLSAIYFSMAVAEDH